MCILRLSEKICIDELLFGTDGVKNSRRNSTLAPGAKAIGRKIDETLSLYGQSKLGLVCKALAPAGQCDFGQGFLYFQAVPAEEFDRRRLS